MHDYFRGDRPWAQFYRFLGRLPRDSHFHASVMDNDEDVELLLQAPQAETFGMAGWTHERELLTSLVDAVNAMHSTLIAVNSDDGKPPRVKQLPRPVTAVDRVEDQQRSRMHNDLVSLVLPNGSRPVSDSSPNDQPEEVDGAELFSWVGVPEHRPEPPGGPVGDSAPA